MIGGIAVIHGDKPARSEVEGIVQFRHPQGVLWIESLNEVTRTPSTEVLWGDVGEVRHHENGYTYILRPSQGHVFAGKPDRETADGDTGEGVQS